jgi:glutamate-1-semialdehyde 2,1-aminomutase
MTVAESREAREFRERNRASGAHAERARATIPTGLSRSLLRHPPFPFYVASADGIRSTDLDGNVRIDLHNNYTALIHGHGHPAILAAVERQLRRGICYSAPGAAELALAELLAARIPGVEQVLFNNSGTESVMVALRAARALTGRDRIGKFEGGYHGVSDFVAVGGHSLPEPNDPRPVTPAIADLGGLPLAATKDTVVIRYNDPEAVRAAVARHGHELAAIIVEPILGAGGMLPAEPEFLAVLREETARAGIVLVCDEVVSLRQHVGGAQAAYGLDADLTTMGKIIGGGFPIGAVGGKRRFMRVFGEGERAVPNFGTFAANPISVLAGVASMEALDAPAIEALNQLGDAARARMAAVLERHGAAAQVSGAGSLFQIHWTREPLRDARAAATGDPDLAFLTFLGLCNRGIHLSMRAGGALSTPMTAATIDTLVEALDDTLRALAAEGWPLHEPRRPQAH